MEETRTADASEQALAETEAGHGEVRRHGSGPGVPRKGDPIGRYVVIDMLGRGGMGVVVSAFDPELDRKVAVKLLRGDTDSTERRLRLIREARAMARLSHPNVISVHDAGEWNGQVFVAMEFIDGETLTAWVASETRLWTDVVAMFAQAAAGLSAAHRAGIVHRDFKPDNCMVDREGRLRVLDFGLANERANDAPVQGDTARGQVERIDAEPASLTMTGAIMGTPAYMAPEQHLRHPTSARSDQFSFCVALFEALYGHRPFRGETPAALMFNVLEGNLRAPEGRTGTPVWLQRALMRGLASEPEERWASMSELIIALERPVRARQTVRRVLGFGVVGLVVAGGFLGAGLLETRRTRVAEEHRKHEAGQRMEELLPALISMAESGEGTQAYRSMSTFADLEDIRETPAVSSGWLALAVSLQEQDDSELWLQASANALAAAQSVEAEQRVLLTLIDPFSSEGRWDSLRAVVDRIDSAHDAEPSVVYARQQVAFAEGDFGTVVDLGDALDSPEASRLAAYSENFRRAYSTNIDPSSFVAVAPYDGDVVRVLELRPDELLVREAAPGLEVVRSVKLQESQTRALRPIPHSGTAVVVSAIPNSSKFSSTFVGEWPRPGPPPLGNLRSVAAVDFDGDGTHEYYGAATYPTRRLFGLQYADDRWSVTTPHPETDALDSDVNSLAVGDIDGDGEPELALGVGSWGGYLVRIFGAGSSPGTLTEEASIELGNVNQVLVVRDGATRRLLAVTANTPPNAAYFGVDDPDGPYGAGVYEIVHDQGEWHPVEIRARTGLYRSFTADLEGDGRDELVWSGREGTGFMDLDGHETLTESFDVQAVGNLDDDGASELIVKRGDEVFVVGDGESTLPAVERPASQVTVPVDLLRAEGPVARRTWTRGETLVQIGLSAQAVEVFERLALAGVEEAVEVAAVLRAAELASRFVSPQRAAEVYATALSREFSWPIAEAAAELAESMHDFELAFELWARGPEGEAKRQALARLEPLTQPPVSVVSHDDPLPDSTGIGSPGAVRFDLDGGLRVLVSNGAGELFRIPFDVDGSFLSVELEGAWVLSEWGTRVEIRLENEQGEVVMGVAGGSGGGAAAVGREFKGLDGGRASWPSRVDAHDAFRIRLEAVGHARLLEVQSVESALHTWKAPEALRAGRYELVFATSSGQAEEEGMAFQRYLIDRIAVRGGTVAPEASDERSQQLLRASNGLDVDVSLIGRGADSLMFAAVELERHGKRAEALEALAAVPPWPNNPGVWTRAIRLDGGRLVRLYEEYLKEDVWAVLESAWWLVATQHPASQQLNEMLLRLPEVVGEPGSPSAKAALLSWRGRMHFYAGQSGWAVRDLEASTAWADEAFEGADDVAMSTMAYSHATRLLARIARSRGHEDVARAWEERHIERAASPSQARRLIDRERARMAGHPARSRVGASGR